MKSCFLNAAWNNLIMANYAVPPDILLPFVPYNTILDSFEGKTYVSLVGFMFMNTKMLGFTIPYHVNFEEVNLRFYVKNKINGTWRRGVSFIKDSTESGYYINCKQTLWRKVFNHENESLSL